MHAPVVVTISVNLRLMTLAASESVSHLSCIAGHCLGDGVFFFWLFVLFYWPYQFGDLLRPFKLSEAPLLVLFGLFILVFWEYQVPLMLIHACFVSEWLKLIMCNAGCLCIPLHWMTSLGWRGYHCVSL